MVRFSVTLKQIENFMNVLRVVKMADIKQIFCLICVLYLITLSHGYLEGYYCGLDNCYEGM